MATFKFSYSEPEYCNGGYNPDASVKVEYSISGELSLNILLEHFEEFLKGAGYSATLTDSMIAVVEREDSAGI
jgi:hypothetical protein